MALYATNRFPGDGTTTSYEFNFVGKYIARTHVKVYQEDNATKVRTYVSINDSNFLNDTTLRSLPVTPAGQTLVIYRDTPKPPIVDFVNGSRFTEYNLDLVARQGLFVAMEALDAGGSDVRQALLETVAAVVDLETAAAASAAIASTRADEVARRNLGSRASPPTTDDHGEPLLTGALYWDTSLSGVRSWNGSTWVTLPAATKAAVGLANVDNTSDASKPISTATQTALNGKANTAHTHAVANVTGLQAALDGKVNTTGDQSIAGVKNFSTTLKASGGIVIPTPGGERQVGWQFSGRAVYFFGRSSDSLVGLFDSVGGLRAIFDASNNFTAGGSITAYSDIRLKTDLTKITDALSKVSRLNGYTYTRKDTGARQTGVVAQEVQEVLPEAVVDNGEHLAVAYGNLVGLLIEAIKELKSEVDQLKGK